ncbi:hypothetical protein O0I10_008407 [Lichtheimia ornata]|uniref:Integrator complex subunit 7 n=1 Tax=Lichtheimia ornata TaxID=688661 RepID=A0AAD7V0L0_9FUNG|nr:uncharacterized protein O0I10_008407 [Lichtheimia ornata]KAJ8655967.1 hypothetical protein O0I10_008407 [Lichtheimia ornata]
MSATQSELSKGHRALLDLEGRFNAKSHGIVLGIQGSQIEALASCIDIFDQFPYPVIINAAILKLADWFRLSNNVIKFYVYRVFKQAAKQHLNKVFNVEETVKRVMPVLGSNDPIARAITLRILGCMSMIIADKLDVHHAILQRLESATDRPELEAAIWAADRICAVSLRFAPFILPRIEAKLDDTTVSLHTKLRLVKLYRHMHQDMSMTRRARESCTNLLSNPDLDEKLTITTLRTLSMLLKEAVFDRKQQMERLFDYALNDPRENVSIEALDDLVLLAHNDIAVDTSRVYRILELVTMQSGKASTIGRRYVCARLMLRSYSQLVGQKLGSIWSSESHLIHQVLDTCERNLQDAIAKKNIIYLITFARFLITFIEIGQQSASTHHLDDMRAVLNEAAIRLNGHLNTLSIDDLVHTLRHRRNMLDTVTRFMRLRANTLLLIEEFDFNRVYADTFDTMTKTTDDTIIDRLVPFLTLVATRCAGLNEWFPDKAFNCMRHNYSRPCLFVNTVKLLFRISKQASSHQREHYSQQLLPLLNAFGGWDEVTGSYKKNTWPLYIIAREAGNHGWHKIMHHILQSLSQTIDSEASKYWLLSLAVFANAEAVLAESDPGSLSTVNELYLRSLTQFQAFRSLTGMKVFGLWFMQLRKEMISTIDQLHQRMCLSRETLAQRRKMTKMVLHCADRFRELAFRYDFLTRSFFGLDKETVGCLDTFKTCALLYELAIQTALNRSGREGIDPSLIPLLGNDNGEQDVALLSTCKSFMHTIMEWSDTHEFSHREQDIREFSNKIIRQPLHLPRYFFHAQRNLTVQLTTEPRLSDQSDSITLKGNEDLVINFEGFVQNEIQEKDTMHIFTKASIVCYVTHENARHFQDQLGIDMILSDPPETSTHPSNGVTFLQPPTTFTADVVNSYFSCKGLLHMPSTTTTSSDNTPRIPREGWLNVFVNIIDKDLNVWAMGPCHSGRISWIQ